MNDLDKLIEEARKSPCPNETLISILKYKIESKLSEHHYIKNVFIDLDIPRPYDLWLSNSKKLQHQVNHLREKSDNDEMIKNRLAFQINSIEQKLTNVKKFCENTISYNSTTSRVEYTKEKNAKVEISYEIEQIISKDEDHVLELASKKEKIQDC